MPSLIPRPPPGFYLVAQLRDRIQVEACGYGLVHYWIYTLKL